MNRLKRAGTPDNRAATMSFWARVSRKIGKAPKADPSLDLLRRCADGHLPLPIALLKLANMTADRGELERLLRRVLAADEVTGIGLDRLRRLDGILQTQPDVHGIVRRMNATLAARPSAVSETSHWSSVFDDAVKISPEACVALYSFGDPALLRQITDELVGKLLQWRVLRPTSRILDYGCGIGRVVEALASRACLVVGADISPGMLREAQSRLTGLENVRLTAVDELEIEEPAFDLILLVDVCPYLKDSRPTLRGLLPALAPDGNLIVINWSYDIASAEQRVLARDFAREHGLVLVREGTPEFTMWDGLVFQFHKAA